jgi:hypothetical protein
MTARRPQMPFTPAIAWLRPPKPQIGLRISTQGD